MNIIDKETLKKYLIGVDLEDGIYINLDQADYLIGLISEDLKKEIKHEA